MAQQQQQQQQIEEIEVVTAEEMQIAPVFVMMPLDIIDPETNTVNAKVHENHQLELLRAAGVAGVMVDCWWGLCEQRPEEYNFNGYLQLLEMCSKLDFKVQVVMSFHKCGGNVGDDVNIPLPEWALSLHETVPELLYRAKDGMTSDDYISLSCDNKEIFPCGNGSDRKRTALEVYESYMRAFKEATQQYIDDGTLVEIQVGAGPCGELRYPSYQLSKGWDYPQNGTFMCFDDGMQAELKEAGLEYVLEKCEEFGPMSAMPDETSFFAADGQAEFHFSSESGKAFLEWYNNRLVQHGEAVLSRARAVFGDKMQLACKIAGIHWQTGHPSKSAELTAGYVGEYFDKIAAMYAKYNVALDFTCLEMIDEHREQYELSYPAKLVDTAMRAAAKHNIKFAGENAEALSDYFPPYAQILNHYHRGVMSDHLQVLGFTLLRLTDQMIDVNGDQYSQLCKFVRLIHHCSEVTTGRVRPHNSEECPECESRRAAGAGGHYTGGELEESAEIGA